MAIPQCQRCAARKADVRMYRSKKGERFLCAHCFCVSGEEQGEAPTSDIARFFSLLACFAKAPLQTDLPAIPADRQCPKCSLSYGQFAADGWLGCAECYKAFAPAIHRALALLGGGL
jgi:protein arginine kinase activator